MINPRPAPLVLTDGERARLATWADDPSAGPLAVRARIVLACAAGAPDLPAARPLSRVAAELGLSRDTVRKWRSRFLAMRLAGLRDAPRPGAPRTITDEQVAGVIARLLLEAPPAGRRRWSTRLMAAETGLSQSAVSRIWRQAGLSGRVSEGSWPPGISDSGGAVPRAGTPGAGAGGLWAAPGRLDFPHIGDNGCMGDMQAGFPQREAPPESPVPTQQAPAPRASEEWTGFAERSGGYRDGTGARD